MPIEIDDEMATDAVNAYRIRSLEAEVEALKRATQTLNFEQIKQMGKWLGIPVAVATGVFGLALWQTIEISAGNRAAAEVQIIAEEIKRLEERIARTSDDALVQFGDLREIFGKADEAVRVVRTRADDARTQASEAERLLAKMRQDLARFPKIQSLLQDTGSIAGELGKSPGFQKAVASAALDSLSGAVVAFNTPCPTALGWAPFQPAQGRVIVGVGSTTDERGETRDFPSAEIVGGEFQHTLTIPEMPPHNHGGIWGGDGGKAGMNNDYAYHSSGFSQVKMEGDGEPHNNMPPYIAMYLCQKETG